MSAYLEFSPDGLIYKGPTNCGICFARKVHILCSCKQAAYCSEEHRDMVSYAHEHACSQEHLSYFKQPEFTLEERCFLVWEWSKDPNAPLTSFTATDDLNRQSLNHLDTLRKTLSTQEFNEMLSHCRGRWEMNRPEDIKIIKNKYHYLRPFYRLSKTEGKLIEQKIPFSEYQETLLELFNYYCLYYSPNFLPLDADKLDQKGKICTISLMMLRNVFSAPEYEEFTGIYTHELMTMSAGITMSRIDVGLITFEGLRDMMKSSIRAPAGEIDGIVDRMMKEAIEF